MTLVERLVADVQKSGRTVSPAETEMLNMVLGTLSNSTLPNIDGEQKSDQKLVDDNAKSIEHCNTDYDKKLSGIGNKTGALEKIREKIVECGVKEKELENNIGEAKGPAEACTGGGEKTNEG